MKWKALNKSQALAILHENFDEYGKTMRDRAELKGEEKKWVNAKCCGMP